MPADFIPNGTCDGNFTPLRDAFSQNFIEGKDVGASLTVIFKDRMVVDLWGGSMDSACTRPWKRETLVTVFSSTKMVTALCILLLADRGQISLDAPLCLYWPEFSSLGKDKILVRHVLSQSAGVPSFTPQVAFEDLFDWDKIIHILEAEKPLWTPGTRLGYHTLTYGFLLGEVIRRVTGKTVGQFLRDEITGPLRIEFYIGLPENEENRVADIINPKQKISPLLLASLKLLFPSAQKNIVNPPLLDLTSFNSQACHSAEIPAGNGIGNARSMAQLGSILANGGVYQGQQVLSRSLVEIAVREQIRGKDAIAFGRKSAWGLGVLLLNKDLLLGPRSFYTTGASGTICIMDLDRQITMAYVMNKVFELSEGDGRSIPLVQKLWECLPAS